MVPSFSLRPNLPSCRAIKEVSEVVYLDWIDNKESSLKSKDFVVVVALLVYVHGKHLRSCRDGQLQCVT